MSAHTVASYGSWSSPLSAQRIAAGTQPLAAPLVDGTDVVWRAGLAAEGGRIAAVRLRGGVAEVVTPAPFNVRSRVHEYGGGALLADSGWLYFSNFADNLVYAQGPQGAPCAITADSTQRHADFVIDRARARLIAVREDHSVAGREARASLVALPLSGAAGIELTAGHDFYAAPRLSPDGTQLAWLCWNHPHMPFERTELWLADVGADGSLARARRIAGGAAESLVQPLWSPRGELFVVSDRSGWWNLYRVRGDALVAVLPMAAEFGQPMWVFGQAMYAFTAEEEIVAACFERGVSKLLRLDLAQGTAHALVTPFTDIDELSAGPGFVVALAASPTEAQQVVRIDAASGAHDVLARSVGALPDAGHLSVPEAIEYPSAGGRSAHAFFYAPRNRDFAAPAGEKPPLVVMGHGGPTSMARSSLRLAIQYWTSRGFAVLDVNYGGSSGYGRAYRDLLRGQWGVVDVEDCVAGARHLAESGRVDGARMAIRGGSAGGFTTLAALAFHRVFKTGASYYGVSDLAALDAETHKFESRYNAYLVAPPGPERERLYAARSPAQHAERLACPMIFFQGLDDKVVVPAQSEVMVRALEKRGIPVAYLAFEGEGHGFRRPEVLARTLEAEAWFYARTFGFELADAVEPVEIMGAAP